MISTAAARVLRTTTTVCPHCHAELPGEVVLREGGVWLERSCPRHGATVHRLAASGESWAELDRAFFATMGPPAPPRDLAVRTTERCGLACPCCLADANEANTPDLDLEALLNVLRGGATARVDLQAAEPTAREDLPEWIRRVKATGAIAAVHTNGVRLADSAYVHTLAEAGVDAVYLPFDGADDRGPDAEGARALRGRPRREARALALANLRASGIATGLVVLVAGGMNEAHVGEALRFVLRPENDHVRELVYLGLRPSGRAASLPGAVAKALMPDDVVGMLSTQEPWIRRRDVELFNRLHFALLSAMDVRKCLYSLHYLVAREEGAPLPAGAVLDLERLVGAAERYAARRVEHPALARAALLAEVLASGARPSTLRLAPDLLRLERFFASGMNPRDSSSRLLHVAFATSCDSWNYDANVARYCGRRELSADQGMQASAAAANLARETKLRKTRTPPKSRSGLEL